MAYYLLSITIPSYNRKNQLHNRIVELLPQLTDEVEVVIIDNCSDYNAEEYIYSEYPKSKDKVRFIRNISNIGANANICRCYEVAQGEWTWILGDDDTIYHDSVKIIIETIKEYAKLGVKFFHHSTEIYQYSEDVIFNSKEDYIKSLAETQNFGNHLFISSAVTNTAVARNNISIGYSYISSFAPHMAIQIHSVSDTNKCMHVKRSICKWVTPSDEDVWNRTTVGMGLPNLMYLNDSDHSLHVLYDGIIHLTPSGLRFKIAIKRIFSKKYRSPRFWKNYYIRLLTTCDGSNLILCLTIVLIAILAEKIKIFHEIIALLIKPFSSHTDDSLVGLERL